MIDVAPPPLWLPPKPAIIRSAADLHPLEKAILPGIAPIISRSGSRGNDANTKLLCHFDGVNGATTFPDSSASNHTIANGGSPSISTTQSKFGGASASFNGSSYLQLDGSADFAFGTGDFTIDCWSYLNNVSANKHYYDSRPTGGTGNYLTFRAVNNTLAIFINGSTVLTSSAALAATTWQHVALVKASGTMTIYVNGTGVGSVANAASLLNPASRPIIGANGNNTGFDQMSGYLDEYRVSNIARWTANFTTPSAPYA